MQIVTGEEMAGIDAETMTDVGIPGITLMENAGHAFTQQAFSYIQPDYRVLVLVGAGNNGGDGFVIARLLQEAGLVVETWLVPPLEKVTGDARKHLEIYRASGFSVCHYDEAADDFSQCLAAADVVIDALLGTGVSGEPREPYQTIIKQLNREAAAVLSVDIPSGVPADGGDVLGEPVQATRTIALQAPKMGALTYPSAAYYGAWQVADIGIPGKVVANAGIQRFIWRDEQVRETWPERAADAHKGSHGKGCLFAGSRDMTGAAVMAARAALRGGAGLLTVAVPGDAHSMIAPQVPEAMFYICDSYAGGFAGNLPADLSSDALAVGPGIGRNTGAGDLVSRLLAQNDTTLIIDADGLYHVADRLDMLRQREAVTVITPHPGEMSHLLACSVNEVQTHRFTYSMWFAQTYNVYVVLKGPYTIVTTPEGGQYVNPTGNPGLATGGSGDVLTGLILAAVMQNQTVQAALSNAVYIHGAAADRLIASGQPMTTLLPTDIIEAINTEGQSPCVRDV